MITGIFIIKSNIDKDTYFLNTGKKEEIISKKISFPYFKDDNQGNIIFDYEDCERFINSSLGFNFSKKDFTLIPVYFNKNNTLILTSGSYEIS